MATRKTAPAKKGTKNVPARREEAKPPALAGRLAGMAGMGLETITQDDLALPFLKLLQALSPQVQRGHEKKIDGAEQGDFYNTVTNELWDGEEGVVVIPCFYEKVYNVWVKRDEGGGFRGSFKTREEAEQHADLETMDVIDTANHYVLVRQEDGSWTEAVFSCTSTKLGASRRWNSLMKQQKLGAGKSKFTPPSFARTYLITSASAENDKGIYHVPKIEADGWVEDEDTFEQAENFYRLFAEKGVKLAYDHADEDVDVEDEEEDEDDPEY